jgi:hypothetical protein
MQESESLEVMQAGDKLQEGLRPFTRRQPAAAGAFTIKAR